jgi:AraC-like DNA-binding protein
MTGMANQLGFDGRALAADARFGAYFDFYAGGADVDRLDGPFEAVMTGWRLDRSLIYDRRLRGVGHRRDAARVRRDGLDHLTLTLVLAGTFHADVGGYRQVRPGEILLLDMTSAMGNRAVDAHIVTMSMARAGVTRAVRDPRELHGRVIGAEDAALLADHMVSLTRHAATLTPPSLMPVARVGLELLRAVVSDEPLREGMTGNATVERIDRVRAFIEEHLFDPRFGPDAVLARFALSRATLYRDFHHWGGLASYIRRRRIEALRERLADPGDMRSLAALAELIGFSSETRLSEAFLRQFGIRPGAYRQAVRAEHEMAAAMRKMREWQGVLR